MEPVEMTLHFDGACTFNPGGMMSFGWHIDLSNGDRVAERSGMIPGYPQEERTNNTAELHALLDGLDWLLALDAFNIWRLNVIGDSELAIRLANGEWQAKKTHIASLTVMIRKTIERLAMKGIDFSFTWVPRAENERADELSKPERPKYR